MATGEILHSVLAGEPTSTWLVVEQVDDHHGNVGVNTTPLPVSTPGSCGRS